MAGDLLVYVRFTYVYVKGQKHYKLGSYIDIRLPIVFSLFVCLFVYLFIYLCMYVFVCLFFSTVVWRIH